MSPYFTLYLMDLGDNRDNKRQFLKRTPNPALRIMRQIRTGETEKKGTHRDADSRCLLFDLTLKGKTGLENRKIRFDFASFNIIQNYQEITPMNTIFPLLQSCFIFVTILL
uniref:Uncharacterized protein n=2 Tax=Arion vulgaris TaxID=1028688 RepID=A0A0B7AJY2_9EUPU